MKVIDRYILKEFLRIFLMSMITLLMFYEMVVFLDMVGYFVKFGATTDMVARYMIFRIPMGVFHVTPICVLLAALLSIGSMSRHSELTALKAAGLSLLRISAPVLLASLAICALSFLDSEYLFHISARESNRIYYDEIKKQPRKGLFANDRIWYKADDGSIWNIGHFDPNEKELKDISIFVFNDKGDKLAARIFASRGKMTNGAWELESYVETRFGEKGAFEEKFEERHIIPAGAISYEELSQAQLDPEEMNLAQIKEYIKDVRQNGYDDTKYTADMHAKVAFPLISLVMPLLATPLAVRSSRAGGALVGIGVAVVTGALFWFTFSMGVAFGQAGKLPPLVSVYGAHIVFALAGVWMFLKQERV
ncbi:MAG: LPS export ABC transporter permease LptG [Nitrospinae bacterium]|nr:LPS export ABC transporter permease LptG [Nitrospinota bacterium]